MLGNAKRQDNRQFYFVGGSNDACGDPEHGWVCRGERMFNRQTYENFWDIMSSIPSLTNPGNSVTDDMFEFSSTKPCKAKARLLDADGEIMDSSSYGLNKQELGLIFNLIKADERELDDITIDDWFGVSPHFYTTPFWYIYEGTFAFQPWSSVMEFRRYLTRFFHLITRINTANGMTLTRHSQFESVIKPLLTVLQEAGVDFIYGTAVTDMDFAEGDDITVVGLHTLCDGKTGYIKLNDGNCVVATLGCMTDNATFGDANNATGINDAYPMSATLWKNIAAKKSGMGNPDKFFAHPDKSKWMTFNCTFHGSTFMDWMEKYTHNKNAKFGHPEKFISNIDKTKWVSFFPTIKGYPQFVRRLEELTGSKAGTGGAVTIKDSSWDMSIILHHKPFYPDQADDEEVFWGYGLFGENVGDYVKKPMCDCTGEEIMTELLYHLNLLDMKENVLSHSYINACQPICKKMGVPHTAFSILM